MPGTTTKGVPYSLGTDTADTIDNTMQALAEWVDAAPGVSALTTVQRDALAAAGKWNGRVIWNTTLGRLERYNTGTNGWVSAGVGLGGGDTITQPAADAFGLRLKAAAAPTVPVLQTLLSDDTPVMTVQGGLIYFGPVAIGGNIARGTLISQSSGRIQAEMAANAGASPAFRAYMATTGSYSGGVTASGPAFEARGPFTAPNSNEPFFSIEGGTGHLTIDRRYSPNTDAVASAMLRLIQHNADFGPVLHISKATQGDILVVTSDGIIQPRTSAGGQTTAKVQLRSINGGVAGAANVLEWGHNNGAGYGCVIGYHTGGGQPFIAFQAEGGGNTGSYTTRGQHGHIIEAAGQFLHFYGLTSVNAAAQGPQVEMRINGGLSSASLEQIYMVARGGHDTIALSLDSRVNGNGANATAVMRFVGGGIMHGDLSWVPGHAESWRFTESSSQYSKANYSSVALGTLLYGALQSRSNEHLKNDIQTIDVTSGPSTKLQRLAASNPEGARRGDARIPKQRTEPVKDRMKELRPVAFRYKDDDPARHPVRHGFIAEELAAALPEVATYDFGGAIALEGTIDPITGETITVDNLPAPSGAVTGYDLGALVTLTVGTLQDVLLRLEALEKVEKPVTPTPTPPKPAP